jgi:UDP-N-acetylglucosamine acyltransferase
MNDVHPTAAVHETAVIAEDVVIGAQVRIGPYCVIERGVRIGEGSILRAHVVIGALTQLGALNDVYPFCSLGLAPQSRKEAKASSLTIGARNTFREGATVHAGTDGVTRLGDDNLLMAQAHVAHDAQIGNQVTLANAVQLAGHVEVADYVTFGGLSGVAQRVRIGESAFVAAGSMCERDIPPCVIVQGDRARIRGINKVGLRRRGIADAQIRELEAHLKRYLFGKESLSQKALTVLLADTLRKHEHLG